MKKIDLGEGYSYQLLDESSADALPEGFQTVDFHKQMEAISLQDAQWFERQPKRGYRLRPPFKGEEPLGGTAILVRVLSPGIRLRMGIQIHEEALSSWLNTAGDNELAKLFQGTAPPKFAKANDNTPPRNRTR